MCHAEYFCRRYTVRGHDRCHFSRGGRFCSARHFRAFVQWRGDDARALHLHTMRRLSLCCGGMGGTGVVKVVGMGALSLGGALLLVCAAVIQRLVFVSTCGRRE